VDSCFKKISRQASEQSVQHIMLIIVGLVRCSRTWSASNWPSEEIVSYLVVYFTVHTVTWAIPYRRMVEWLVNDVSKPFERRRSWPIRGAGPVFTRRDERNSQKTM